MKRYRSTKLDCDDEPTAKMTAADDKLSAEDTEDAAVNSVEAENMAETETEETSVEFEETYVDAE